MFSSFRSFGSFSLLLVTVQTSSFWEFISEASYSAAHAALTTCGPSSCFLAWQRPNSPEAKRFQPSEPPTKLSTGIRHLLEEFRSSQSTDINPSRVELFFVLGFFFTSLFPASSLWSSKVLPFIDFTATSASCLFSYLG